jgi:hypothetical protein
MLGAAARLAVRAAGGTRGRVAVGPPAAGVAVRCVANVPSWKRKAARKAVAADTRVLLRLAAEYDPVGQAGIGLKRTLSAMGWSVSPGEVISDGLAVQFAQTDKFVAFEIVPTSACVPPAHADASTTPASPLVTGAGGDAKRAVPPVWTPFPAAPAPWDNPALGLVLDKATAARHATIRGKGWKLVAVPQPLWEVACRGGAYARRDLLLSLTLPLAPFDARPVATGLAAGSAGAGSGATGAGGAGATTSPVSTSTSNRSKRASERGAAAAAAASGAPSPAAAARGTQDKLLGAAKRSLGGRRRGGRRGSGAAAGEGAGDSEEAGGWAVVQDAEDAAAEAAAADVKPPRGGGAGKAAGKGKGDAAGKLA